METTASPHSLRELVYASILIYIQYLYLKVNTTNAVIVRFKNCGSDSCEGDALMINVTLWPDNGLQPADVGSSTRLGSLQTLDEEVLRTKLAVGVITQWKISEAAPSQPDRFKLNP